MKTFIILFILVALKNADASELRGGKPSIMQKVWNNEISLSQAKFEQCIEEQKELIEENRESYSDEEIADQYKNLNTMCGE